MKAAETGLRCLIIPAVIQLQQGLRNDDRYDALTLSDSTLSITGQDIFLTKLYPVCSGFLRKK